MKLVLLSGGSGKRLWPLSNDSRSKQFLKVLRGKNGGFESMVQRVWRQLEAAGMAESCYIATGKSQLDIMHSQLGDDVPIIVEPQRRDTFPAIALASAYLYSMVGASSEEVVCFLPVDPYAADDFFHRVKDLENAVETSGADLALMGVRPTYPSAKYGYIVPLETAIQTDSYLNVSHFTEKPDEATAQCLIEQNALWNCGIFAFKLGYMTGLLQDKGFPLQYEELVKQYDLLPKISFDYEVAERAKHIVVLPYDGEWKDLGTWNTLTEEMDTNLIGKGIISEDSNNTHLINELDIPVTVLGLSNAVVATGPDGILVADKKASPRIKEMMKDLDQRPMYEERRWGWYRVLDYTKFAEGNVVLTKRLGISAGKNLSYQTHAKRSEVWTIISGFGEFALNDKMTLVKPGDVLEIPVGARHAIKALTDLEFIEVQTGSELIEEDIVRLCMTWEEVKQFCRMMD